MPTPSDHPIVESADRHTAPRPVRPATPAEVQAVLPRAEGLPREARPVPPVVYLPVSPDSPADDPLVEFRRLASGETVLLAYTALDRLVEGLGADQPWVAVETKKLADLERVMPYDAIMLDRVLPEALRHGDAS